MPLHMHAQQALLFTTEGKSYSSDASSHPKQQLSNPCKLPSHFFPICLVHVHPELQRLVRKKVGAEPGCLVRIGCVVESGARRRTHNQARLVTSRFCLQPSSQLIRSSSCACKLQRPHPTAFLSTRLSLTTATHRPSASCKIISRYFVGALNLEGYIDTSGYRRQHQLRDVDPRRAGRS
jgi:hypothetical protein